MDYRDIESYGEETSANDRGRSKTRKTRKKRQQSTGSSHVLVSKN